MFARPVDALLRAWIAVVLCAGVAGCALQATTAGGIDSVRDAQAAVTIGKSTKVQVEAALGKATVVSFDSGYEVWVYREKAAATGLFGPPRRERAEFVLLFEPSGVVRKMRVRMPSAQKVAAAAGPCGDC